MFATIASRKQNRVALINPTVTQRAKSSTPAPLAPRSFLTVLLKALSGVHA